MNTTPITQSYKDRLIAIRVARGPEEGHQMACALLQILDVDVLHSVNARHRLFRSATDYNYASHNLIDSYISWSSTTNHELARRLHRALSSWEPELFMLDGTVLRIQPDQIADLALTMQSLLPQPVTCSCPALARFSS